MADRRISSNDLARLKKTADLLDNWIRIPGTRLSFGLDGLLGLLPVVGDTATLIAGLVIIARAHRAGISGATLIAMLANVGVDYALGSVPVVGDIFDFFWKSNRRNIRLLEKEIERQH